MNPPFALADTEIAGRMTQLEASAGTGKTYTITGLVVRLLLEGAVEDLSQILVVTFTIAATEELKTRIRDGLRSAVMACERHAATADDTTPDDFYSKLGRRHGAAGAKLLRRALSDADRMSVSTIHSFCNRVLQETAFETGQRLATDFLDDEGELIKVAAADAMRDVVLAGDPILAALCDLHGIGPNRLISWLKDTGGDIDAVFLPTGAPLADCTRALLESVQQAAQALDETLATLLSTGSWKHQHSFRAVVDGSSFVELVQERLEEGPARALPLLLELRPDQLATYHNRRKSADKDHYRQICEHPAVRVAAKLPDLCAAAIAALRQALWRRFGERFRAEKERLGARSFADLQSALHRALADPSRGPALRRAIGQRWLAALIDEFQDTDPLQYEIFRDCFQDGTLLFVGDPKQSIYGFRGADLQTYMRARADAKACYSLQHNHRSHPELVAGVAAVFSGKSPFLIPELEHPPVEAARRAEDCAIVDPAGARAVLQVRWLPPEAGELRSTNKAQCEQAITEDLVREVARLLGSDIQIAQEGGARRLSHKDIAVLVRTNQQARNLLEALTNFGIHAVLTRSGNVFQSPEAADLSAVVRGLTPTSRHDELRGAFASTLWGVSTDDLRDHDHNQRIQQALQLAAELRQVWHREGIMVTLQTLMQRTRAHGRVLQMHGGERILTNYLQLAELLHHTEHDLHLGPNALDAWLQQQRSDTETSPEETHEMRLESDEAAVHVMTGHVSKGLQFPVVFVPFAWSFSQPPANRADKTVRLREEGRLHLDFAPSTNNNTAALRDEIAEGLRQIYVSLTRAKHRCYLYDACYVASSGTHKSALAWLLHGPGRPGGPAVDGGLDVATQLQEVGQRVAAWPDDLAQLAALRPSAIHVHSIGRQEEPPLSMDSQATPELPRGRSLPRAGRPRYWISSFTSLQRAEAADELLVEDQADEPDSTAAATPADEAQATGIHPHDATVDRRPKGIFAFARGAKAGICMHELIEHAHLDDDDSEPRRALVQRTLASHGLADPSRHEAPIDSAETLLEMLDLLANQPLGNPAFRMRDVPRESCRHEWEFFLSTGDLRPSELAEIFARHAGATFKDYAIRMRRLSRQTTRGFLRGFVDLLCEVDGRYWILDWKSNHLGYTTADYDQKALLQEMQHNDYVLQYHLYLLALHRHLGSRLKDYDYERHIGGACYVFVRGLDQEQQDRGVFTHRPSLTMIEAMDAWLGGEGVR